MFTGIVEEAGRVLQLIDQAGAIRLEVQAKSTGAETKIGDSIAVNGCCLTVVAIEEGAEGQKLSFDLLQETSRLTNLHALGAGSLVNLERSMPADGRIHGHFVTGHVDATGTILTFEKRGADWYLRIHAPPEILRFVVWKGAIAVDGMSLTIAEVSKRDFAVWIIPHTHAVTALREREVGSLVNLEADLLAKYVQKIVAPGGQFQPPADSAAGLKAPAPEAV